MGTATFLFLAAIALSTCCAAHSGSFTHRYSYGRFPVMPSCYMFVTTAYTWQEARDNCRKHGGNLVSIETKAENDHLLRTIKRHYKQFYFWTGGNELSSEGEWQWMAYHSPLLYTDWHPGQPSGNEHCLEMMKPHDWNWNDAPCYYKRASICEKSC